MATIEERARQHALAAVYGDKNDALYKDIETECIKLATEQDRIARAEERERCIKAALNWYCDIMRLGYYPTHKLCNGCDRCEKLRKAMEGGEG